MIFVMLERMKQRGVKKRNTTIESIQSQVQLNNEYHDDDSRYRIRRLLHLAKKKKLILYIVKYATSKVSIK